MHSYDHPPVSIDRIHVGARRRQVNDEKLPALAQSIARDGLLHPIGVRSRLMPGEFDLVYGAHRLAAWELLVEAGEVSPMIPVVVLGLETDTGAAIAEITENLQRSKLTSEQRTDQRRELVALIERQAKETGKPLDSLGGRGRKGAVSQVAEIEGVSRQAVQASINPPKPKTTTKSGPAGLEITNWSPVQVRDLIVDLLRNLYAADGAAQFGLIRYQLDYLEKGAPTEAGAQEGSVQ